MNIMSTTSINGIFLLFVFYRHLNQYAQYSSKYDFPMNYIDGRFDQFLVVTFLFFSGFGIYESIKKKDGGYNYIFHMPKNRILKVYLQFALAITIFVFIGLLVNHYYSINQLLLSYLGWSSIGNSNWYIFCILMCYLFVYVSFLSVGEDSHQLSLILVTVMSFLYVLIIQKYK